MMMMIRMMMMRMMKKMVRLTFMSLPLAIMPKTLVFTAFFCSLYNSLRSTMSLLPPPPHPPTPRHTSKTPKTPQDAEKQRLTPGAWRRG